MSRIHVLALLLSVTLPALAVRNSQSDQTPDRASDGLPPLPHPPPGNTTVIGGRIEKVDLVRDQFTLAIYGARPLKILFDARTELYRDGKKITARDLRADDRASVETVLDGTNVFAVSIHMLSRTPVGEYQGQLVSFNPETRALAIKGGLSDQPLTLIVPPGTPVDLQAQTRVITTSNSDAALTPRSLISVEFVPGAQGRGIVQRIAVLATPGSAYTFAGTITFLDLHSGQLVLTDAEADKSYSITFDPALLPATLNLHQGQHISATTTFDGTRYLARAINVQ